MKANCISILIVAVIFLLAAESQAGVMEITLNNLKNVLSTYEQLFVLFHNPQCTHSRKYVESFLKADTQYKLGVVDCLTQYQLCIKYNFTNFPVLAKLNIQNQTQIVDQQQFLVDHKLKNSDADEAVLNRFVKYLEREPHYAIVVFQDEGLPTLDSQKLLEQQEHVFYLQPYNQDQRSNFTQMLSSLVNYEPGCWIIRKASNRLQKYFCESGYNKTITKKYIDLFRQGKLKKYVFTQQKSILNSQLNAQSLYEMLDKENSPQQIFCYLIYFSSSYCPSCSSKDIKNINKITKKLNVHSQIQVAKYNVDKNQIPQRLINLGLKRVPELIYFCNSKIRIFGEVFFLSKIQKFINEHHLQKSDSTLIQEQLKENNQPFTNNSKDQL